MGDGPDQDARVRVMTVARVREVVGRDTDVMFNESARIYRLSRSLAGYDGFVVLLREANATGAGVRVCLTAAHGDVIESVSDPENE